MPKKVYEIAEERKSLYFSAIWQYLVQMRTIFSELVRGTITSTFISPFFVKHKQINVSVLNWFTELINGHKSNQITETTQNKNHIKFIKILNIAQFYIPRKIIANTVYCTNSIYIVQSKYFFSSRQHASNSFNRA